MLGRIDRIPAFLILAVVVVTASPGLARAQVGADSARKVGLTLMITPVDGIQMPVGTSFRVSAYYSAPGRTLRPKQVTYRVRDQSLCSIDATGRLAARAEGTTEVEVSDGRQQRIIRVVVVAKRR